MAHRDDQKRQIRDATDIVALIGEHVALKPKGREYVGVCPFHDDHAPSMNVVPAKQIYHCFSCGAGGDVFTFVMEFHRMDFRQALEYLAQRLGIELEPMHPGDRRQSSESRSRRDALLQANGQALTYYQQMLADPKMGDVARRYLHDRGMSREMIEAFQVGYAPNEWDHLTQHIASRRWEQRAFEEAGLIAPRRSGSGCFDKLRHRIIFPICDALGRPIAFGGRRINEEDNPKYLNSPETALFNKSATLYGLHLAKQSIIRTHTAIIVEGYTDVIACHQHGHTNVVAALGTAFTNEHAKALKHIAQKVVLIFDADEAGQKAAERALELLLDGTLDVAIAVLPDKLDPAELLATEHGSERWTQAISDADDALEYQYQRVRARFDTADTLAGREEVATDYLRKLTELGLLRAGALRRSFILQRLAELLPLTQPQIESLLKQFKAEHRPRRPAPPAINPPTPEAPRQTERPLVQDVVIGEDGYPQLVEELPDDTSSIVIEGPVVTQTTPPPPPGSTSRAVLEAERLLVAGLIQNSACFTMALSSGHELADEITPADLADPNMQRVFERVYEQLAEGRETTISELLATLAEENAPELVRLVTQADAQFAAAVGDDGERATQVVRDAAEYIVRQRHDRDYHRARQALLEAREDGDAVARLLRQVAERNASPSPTRISRTNM